MLQLGWKAGPEQYPPTELCDYAVAAEQAGFDTIDASDHFHPWSEAGQAAFTWTWLGAAAVRTSRIHLGTGITCPILKTGCFSPNADDHVKFVQQYIDLGFNVIFFHAAGPDQRLFLEKYGRDVLPRLRA